MVTVCFWCSLRGYYRKRSGSSINSNFHKLENAYFGTEDDSADAQIHVCTVHKVVIWIAAVENLRERAALFLQESSPTPPVAKLL
jgi:hypothetical protein